MKTGKLFKKKELWISRFEVEEWVAQKYKVKVKEILSFHTDTYDHVGFEIK